jgi:iron complex transport system ATP-binding protein
MSRTLRPVAGTILVEGMDISVYSRKELAGRVSVVPQESPRTFDYTVEEVVGMGRYVHQGLLSGLSVQDRDACHAAMTTAGITPLAMRRISSLSGGEWQRVLIARTLAQGSDIILLDEPTSHLDVNHQIEVLSALHALTRAGTTAISVFHDLNLAAHFCDEIIVLKAGKAVAIGPPRDVITPLILKEVFGLGAAVRIHPVTGKPLVVPLYALPPSGSSSARVHVICGGGSGSEILHALRAAGCRITAGVLAMNDSDYSTAIALSIPCIAEPPFSPISEESRAALINQIKGADAVVLTPMPVGAGNLENLHVLLECTPPSLLFLGKDGGADIEDFTGGRATAVIEGLISSGRLAILPTDAIIRQCTTRGRY